ncbi:lysine--tRNA ligase [Candidatus Pacearchaeota archaeon RBG_13_36_9]|nr:MAG: lysine--tRNA ligase [Candidatus Pacearchaeota archaeon RBG_13_36_9]
MAREEEIIKERLKKLEEFRKSGINPYPHWFEKENNAGELQKEYKKLKNEEFGKKAVVAGRIMALRSFGKLAFMKLQDETGNIQLVFIPKKGDKQGEKRIKEIIRLNDVGDIVGCSGKVFRTKRGELSVMAEEIKMLAKSIKPLPEKWHGLTDKEERYRKRYLDLIMNPEVRKVFEKRTAIMEAIRELLKEKGFSEVETPFLNTLYGGAAARPFETKLNALDMKLYLAISPELYLKRLVVGGYEKVFTISRNFRNEGIDRWHNPEFAMMEIYQAYADYNDMMNLFEEIYESACKKVNGGTKVEFRGKTIDFKRPWKRMTMAQAIKEFGKIDVTKMSEKEVLEHVKKNNIEIKEKTWGWAVQGMFEHYCEDKIEQPTFILDHPLETTPLCKVHRNGSVFCSLIERFEPFCMGTELGNAYSELNDPILQRKLLEDQQKMLSKGDLEANPLDEDFINAIEIGMPPTGGLGLGIDRMVMLLTGQESIRDVILFPFMKEKENC